MDSHLVGILAVSNADLGTHWDPWFWLIIGLVVVNFFVAIWALCVAAKRGDEAMNRPDEIQTPQQGLSNDEEHA